MPKVKKMLYAVDPSMDRLVKLARKELKQQNEAKVPPLNKQRCRNQAIVNFGEGCVTAEGCKEHLVSIALDYGMTGAEAKYLNSLGAKFTTPEDVKVETKPVESFSDQEGYGGWGTY